MRHRCYLVKFIVAGAVALFVSLPAIGQTIESKLSQPVASFESERLTIEGQLLDFARQLQIPIGIELVAASPNKVGAVRVFNSTAVEVLQRILQQASGYDFDITDGVLNVYPTRLVGDPRNFLNLRLAKFEIKNQTLIGARYYLKLTIQQALHPKMNYGGGYGGTRLNNDLDEVKINLSTDNLTVRQNLNRLILAEGNAGWIVRLNPAVKMRDESLYAQTATVGSNDVAPDFFWEFIAIK